ncbi:unnamed protein product [Ophioblennius macclurei]
MENTQYDSFLFWRQPIPELELSELEDLGLTSQPSKGAKGRDKVQDEAELSQFSSFNFWRAPIGEVDALLADLNLLL